MVIPPLKKIDARNLEYGKQYLIEYTGQHVVSNPKFKGTFIGNILPECEYQCILSKFTNVIDKGNVSISIDLKLQDCFYSYYETGALKRAYTRHILQQITGDNNFTFDSY